MTLCIYNDRKAEHDESELDKIEYQNFTQVIRWYGACGALPQETFEQII